MAWNVVIRETPKSTAADTINALSAADAHFTNLAGASDSEFATQLAAAQAGAVAALAAVTGGVGPNLDVILSGRSDAIVGSPNPHDAGASVTIQLIERF